MIIGGSWMRKFIIIFLLTVCLCSCGKEKVTDESKELNKINDTTIEALDNLEGNIERVYKDGKYGYINDKGEEIISCIYDYAFNFSEGLGTVYKSGKWGYVNEVGKEVVPCIYEKAGIFSEGLAFVKKNNVYGYIDKNGNEVIPCIYNNANDFSEGIAKVSKNWDYIYIDKEGNEVIPPVGKDDVFQKEWAKVYNEGEINIGIDFNFEKVGMYNDSVFIVEEGGLYRLNDNLEIKELFSKEIDSNFKIVDNKLYSNNKCLTLDTKEITEINEVIYVDEEVELLKLSADKFLLKNSKYNLKETFEIRNGIFIKRIDDKLYFQSIEREKSDLYYINIHNGKVNHVTTDFIPDDLMIEYISRKEYKEGEELYIDSFCKKYLTIQDLVLIDIKIVYIRGVYDMGEYIGEGTWDGETIGVHHDGTGKKIKATRNGRYVSEREMLFEKSKEQNQEQYKVQDISGKTCSIYELGEYSSYYEIARIDRETKGDGKIIDIGEYLYVVIKNTEYPPNSGWRGEDVEYEYLISKEDLKIYFINNGNFVRVKNLFIEDVYNHEPIRVYNGNMVGNTADIIKRKGIKNKYKEILHTYTKKDVMYIFQDDYDENGKMEAFVFTGENAELKYANNSMKGELWYVSGDVVENVLTYDDTVIYSYMGVANIGNRKVLLLDQTSTNNIESRDSICYEVNNYKVNRIEFNENNVGDISNYWVGISEMEKIDDYWTVKGELGIMQEVYGGQCDYVFNSIRVPIELKVEDNCIVKSWGNEYTVKDVYDRAILNEGELLDVGWSVFKFIFKDGKCIEINETLGGV